MRHGMVVVVYIYGSIWHFPRHLTAISLYSSVCKKKRHGHNNNCEWNKCVCVHFILFHDFYLRIIFCAPSNRANMDFFSRSIDIYVQYYIWLRLWLVAIGHWPFDIVNLLLICLYLHIASTTHFNYTLSQC